MKTTVSIHLGGHLMHAEEDAHCPVRYIFGFE